MRIELKDEDGKPIEDESILLVNLSPIISGRTLRRLAEFYATKLSEWGCPDSMINPTVRMLIEKTLAILKGDETDEPKRPKETGR